MAIYENEQFDEWGRRQSLFYRPSKSESNSIKQEEFLCDNLPLDRKSSPVNKDRFIITMNLAMLTGEDEINLEFVIL